MNNFKVGFHKTLLKNSHMSRTRTDRPTIPQPITPESPTHTDMSRQKPRTGKHTTPLTTTQTSSALIALDKKDAIIYLENGLDGAIKEMMNTEIDE